MLRCGMAGNVNEFIEDRLNENLAAIEEQFEASALSFHGRIVSGVDDVIRAAVERLREGGGRRPPAKRLVVVLTTSGGFIEVVQRIVDTLRYHYRTVEFVVPNYAYSAGTVLAMSGDAIHMDYYSRLGPIDPQVETASGRLVPALGYLEQYERLIKKAEEGSLTLPEAQLLIDGFDQAELYQYEQARELSVQLLKEWLASYKFKNWTRTEGSGRPVTKAMREERAEEIARALNDTRRWHVHGHGISMAVLQKDLRLRIDDFGSHEERREAVKAYDGLLVDYLAKRDIQDCLHVAGDFVPLRF